MGNVCAAPHLPAGILPSYSDGERGARINDFAKPPRLRPVPSPRHYTGEVPGRAMRGSADFDKFAGDLTPSRYRP
ncbi:MAG: hypothetical protein E5Y63_20570 [Mesorhizobium sp.]|nr:MAG: hypothetical protein E5Y63_20570 [Mesorhizobium sp.]